MVLWYLDRWFIGKRGYCVPCKRGKRGNRGILRSQARRAKRGKREILRYLARWG